jgi:hypothetical protein
MPIGVGMSASGTVVAPICHHEKRGDVSVFIHGGQPLAGTD